MVTARVLTNKFVKPIIDKHKAEGRREGKAEGREEGLQQGRQAALAEVRDWDRRRREAEARGEIFDEPPPGV